MRGNSVSARSIALVSLACVAVACSGGHNDNLKTSYVNSAEAGTEAGTVTNPATAADADVPQADADVLAEMDADVANAGDGAAPSNEDASAPDAVILPYCGNGHIDEGEGCDDGESNSNTRANACRSDCLAARCGDQVIDEGEVCDDGATNSDSEPNACRTSCVRPRCGDGVRDDNEGCDTGSANSNTTPGACRISCVLARCGDQVVDPNEGCDDGNTNDADDCRNNCREARCGNRVTDPGEQCDDGNDVGGDGCQPTCRSPICGDGFRDPNEACDDGNTSENDGCRNDCTRGCTQASDCNDGQFCNGVERCGTNGRCAGGTPVVINDNVSCTVDSCDEATDSVVHRPDNSLCAAIGPGCTGGVRTTHSVSCTAQGCVDSPSSMTCSDPANACTPATDGTITLNWFAPACSGTSCGTPTTFTDICRPGAPSCSVQTRVATLHPPTCDAPNQRCGTGTTIDNCARLDQGTCTQDGWYRSAARGDCSGGKGCEAVPQADANCNRAAECNNGFLTSFRPVCTNAVGCGTAEGGAPQRCSTPDTRCDTDMQKQLAHYSYTPSCADKSSCSTAINEVKVVCNDGPTKCVAATKDAPFGSQIAQVATCSVAGGCSTRDVGPSTCPTSYLPTCSATAPRLIIHRAASACVDGTGCSWRQTDTSSCTAFCELNAAGARTNRICSELCTATPNGAGCTACRDCGALFVCNPNSQTTGIATCNRLPIVIGPVLPPIGTVVGN